MSSRALSLRCGGPWPPDITGGITKPLEHHGRQVLRLVRHATAGTNGVAILMRQMCGRRARLQRACALHDDFTKMHDAEIGGAEMLAGAVGDRTLAVLHGG